MMMRHLRWYVPVLLLAVGTLSAGQDVNRTLSAARDGSIEIENLAGSVRVIGWDKGQIEITGTLGRGTEELEIESERDETRIEVVIPSGTYRDLEGSDLVIRVPRGSEVSVETVSADIEVDGVNGSVDAETVSGNVDVRGAPQSVSAESVSGDVTVEGGPKEVELASVSGNIEFEDGGDLEDGEFESVSGNIRARADFGSGDFEFETVSGTIEVRVPSGVSAEFDVETFSGSIRADFGPRVDSGDYGMGKTLSFSLGSGDASISISSFSGSIRILKD
jgi:DUF4097 and DUF4098 domain-containing protein YvlB